MYTPEGYLSEVSTLVSSPEVETAEEAVTLDEKSVELRKEIRRDSSSDALLSMSRKESIAAEQKDISVERRRSHSWKGFGLKKRLSKVDSKLKHTFSVSANISGSANKPIGKSKRSSVFYFSDSSPMSSPTEPEKPETSLEPQSTQDDSTYSSTGNIPTAQSHCDEQTNEMAHGKSETSQLTESKVPESISTHRLSDEVRSDPKDCEDQFIGLAKSEASHESSSKTCDKQNRPKDLPLFDSEGRPVRPPRNNKKKLHDRRESKIAAAPKPLKTELSVRDLRREVPTSNTTTTSSSTYLGNLMRRFSKFISPLSTVVRFILDF